ncbi:MAG: hypothetical protein ACR2QK_02880 [Acidimicrobiales bacterium]
MSGAGEHPAMDQWRELSRSFRAEWTGRGQGVATDGLSWFVAQNDRDPGISRYSPDFVNREARIDIPRSTAGHVGAVSILDGSVYVALEGPERVMRLDRDLDQQGLVSLDRPLEADDKRHLAWCAINPANGLLYTCDWNNATRLDAYDPATGDEVVSANIELASSIHRTQGGVFSDRGRVYLASDEKIGLGEQVRRWLGPLGGGTERAIFPGIHGFDARTGAKLGYVAIPTRPHFPHFEEIEGLGLGPMKVDGVMTHVHLTMLDKNHSWVRDDVHIKSFEVPEPGLL